jgi:hypothetical protein
MTTNNLEEQRRHWMAQDPDCAHREAVDMASRFPPAWAKIRIVQAQDYVEHQLQLHQHEKDTNSIRQKAQQSWVDMMSSTGKLVYAKHVCDYCSLAGHIKECCPQRYPLKIPVQTSPADDSAGCNGLPVPVF